MASFIKTVYKSGIIGDFFKGTLSSKPDNTVERIVCIRKYDNGRCVKYEQPLWVNEVIINKDCNENNYMVFSNPLNAFFFSPISNAPTFPLPPSSHPYSSPSSSPINMKKTQPTSVSTMTMTTTVTPPSKTAPPIATSSYFETNYKQMIKGLLGDADHGTIYITYWYGSLRYVMYWDIPAYIVRFPLYAPEPASEAREEEQMTFTDDDQFVVFVHLVFRKDRSCSKEERRILNNNNNDGNNNNNDNNEHDGEEEEILDVTDLVKPFIGPKNDFHGMTLSSRRQRTIRQYKPTTKQLFDFMKVVDYTMFVDKRPIAASSVHRLHHVSFMRITYGDMSVTELYL